MDVPRVWEDAVEDLALEGRHAALELLRRMLSGVARYAPGRQRLSKTATLYPPTSKG